MFSHFDTFMIVRDTNRRKHCHRVIRRSASRQKTNKSLLVIRVDEHYCSIKFSVAYRALKDKLVSRSDSQ